VGICKAGTQTCSGGAWSACAGQVLPAAEVCDSLDNDCDGAVNDGIGPQSCYTGPAGTLGVGACKAGTRSCTTSGWSACTGQVLPAAETCDNLDNDCDGQKDENLSQACYTGPAGTLNVGLCRAGTQTCSAGLWGACTGQVLPAAEICDGLDNDCNGGVDPGCGTCNKCVAQKTPLSAGCGSVVAAVCAYDSWCCTYEWDEICVREVRTVAGSLACGESAGSCAHTLCALGISLVSGCDAGKANCVSKICFEDPYCCSSTGKWDSLCVGEVTTYCSGYNCD
jgi:hypothetical protein